MDGFMKKIALLCSVSLLFFTLGCATGSSSGDGADFPGSDSASVDSSANSLSGSEDTIEAELAQNKESKASASNDDLALSDEPTKTENKPAPENAPQTIPVEPEPAPLPNLLVEEPTPVVPTPAPEIVESKNSSVRRQIKRLQFKATDGGNLIVIEGDGPLQFTTRTNSATNQFIINVPNAFLTKKALMPLNTKDFSGSVGAVDTYNDNATNSARILVQLRDGAIEPLVQSEGNSLLITSVNTKSEAPSAAQAEQPQDADSAAGETTFAQTPQSKLLSTTSLEEFLGTNQQFYGKKISIEANDAEIRDIIKFISDESGVNLVLHDEVKGKLSLKLRQIPWDQALVVIMKTHKLGYSRQGQILRIARLDDLKKEEEDFAKAAKLKQTILPLYVKMIPVSYAKVDQLVTQVQPFLSERGKVIAEPRTSAIVISDIEENIAKIQKLITSLDTPPAQVLIEGKVVEARDTFSRTIGLNWNSTGESIDLGTNTKGGKQTINTTAFRSSTGASAGSGTLNFSLGTIDLLGDLTATLALGENVGDVKVLSSPRILTLHNEPAEISQTTQIPLLSTNVSTTGQITTSATFKDIPLKLTVTPQVTNDASVILAVDVNRGFAGDIVDQASQARSINTRAAKTKVIVRNGQTAVIGGIYQTDSSTSETRIPVLADIPVLGWLFKSRQVSREKNELMIFLTPRIVGQADSGISSPIPLGPTGSAALPDLPKASEGSSESKSPQAPEGGLQL